MGTKTQLWRLAPLAAAAIVLVAGAVGPGFGIAGVHVQTDKLVVLAALALGAMLYRLRGWPSLALGAFVLPLAIETSGAIAAALLAVALLAGRQAIGWLLESEGGGSGDRRSAVFDLLLGIGPVALAVVAAGWLGSGLSEEALRLAVDGARSSRALADPGALAGLGPQVLAGLAYLAVFGSLTFLTRLGSRTAGERSPHRWSNLRPFLLDALGWACGLVLLLVVTLTGWPAAIILGGTVGAMSAAALAANLHAGRERKVANRLRDVHLAGHRIIFRQSDLLAIAGQICSECRGVVPCDWFHLELRDPDGQRRHWGAGPEGGTTEGRPEPPPTPPRASRVGRRRNWKVVSRDLSTGDRTLGRIRMWCDPRKVGDGEVDWLDSFLPEVSSAIERAFLNREARRDSLTDLPDRRVLESRLEDVFHRSVSTGAPMSVIMVDIDHFKSINDQHGHAIGDQALVEVTRLLEEHRRDTDVCCRYGGEEFALVLEDADGRAALAVAERIRRAVETAHFAPEGTSIPLRLSAGVASFPALAIQKGSELVPLADAALYQAKRAGRNRCLLNMGAAGFGEMRPRPRAVSSA